MAVLTTILSPDPMALSAYRYVIDSIAPRILPPTLIANTEIRISEENGLLAAVLGRSDNVSTHGFSNLAGVTVMTREQPSWWCLDGPVPEGSFALLRAGEFVLEAVTDYAGSKTIWHARLECGGVVTSTSVEVIVALLGKFSLDETTLGWFLSSGTCGPRRSWDQRIKPLPPNSRLRAQKEGTKITLRETSLERPLENRKQVDATSLATELSQTMSNSCFGDKPWVLALSGGYDSRAILHGTRHIKELTCVTWVDEFLVDKPNSDLAIARLLAKNAGRKHVVKVIKRPADADQLDQALRRFVRYCDGRVDNYLAYVDGMQIWDELSLSEAGGLLRGDELFGSAIATKTPQILQNMRLIAFSDYAGSLEQNDLAARYHQETPADLLQRPGEKIERWRWRLRADYEIPTVYAALNSIRARFIEVSCPLLTGNLVRCAASMSGKDLNDKSLFSQVVSGAFPDIPFASRSSILRRADVLAIPQATELVLDHLDSAFALEALGARCSKKVGEELLEFRRDKSTKIDSSGIVAKKKSFAPVWVKQLKRRFDSPPRLQLPTLGMRSYLAKLVQEEMTATADLGSQARIRFEHAKR